MSYRFEDKKEVQVQGSTSSSIGNVYNPMNLQLILALELSSENIYGIFCTKLNLSCY